MNSQSAPTSAPAPPSKLLAWRNALAITLLGILVLGLGGFVLVGRALAQSTDLFGASIWFELAFGGAAVVIVALIVAWQRVRGSSLAELGWGKPTTPLAMVLAFLLAAALLGMSTMGAKRWLPEVDVFELHWARFALAPVALFMAIMEEMLMRGLFMTELNRARVATWLQIVASGACTATYHAAHNPTLMGYLPSAVLFTLFAGLYVLGKRSLTPVILAHAIMNVLGEPYLLMMVLAMMRAQSPFVE